MSGLENLARELEKEAAIIRGFLAKNYGHFDSRYLVFALEMVILLLYEGS